MPLNSNKNNTYHKKCNKNVILRRQFISDILCPHHPFGNVLAKFLISISYIHITV